MTLENLILFNQSNNIPLVELSKQNLRQIGQRGSWVMIGHKQTNTKTEITTFYIENTMYSVYSLKYPMEVLLILKNLIFLK